MPTYSLAAFQERLVCPSLWQLNIGSDDKKLHLQCALLADKANSALGCVGRNAPSRPGEVFFSSCVALARQDPGCWIQL